jgi:hypothetical protein
MVLLSIPLITYLWRTRVDCFEGNPKDSPIHVSFLLPWRKGWEPESRAGWAFVFLRIKDARLAEQYGIQSPLAFPQRIEAEYFSEPPSHSLLLRLSAEQSSRKMSRGYLELVSAAVYPLDDEKSEIYFRAYSTLRQGVPLTVPWRELDCVYR